MFLITFMAVAERSAKKAAEISDSLIAEIAKGSRSAFEEFYMHSKTAVYSFALSILKNPHDAQDVMHDAYIRIHSCAASYKPLGKPMAWVFTIVRNLCLMHLRSTKNSSAEYLDEVDSGETEDYARAFEDNEIVSFALNILSEDERNIVVLHAVSGMKHKDISALLNLPLSTVLSKYNRSLHKMKKQLEERGT